MADEHIPWDEPGGRPLRAFRETLVACLRHPLTFFARVPASEDRWAAMSFALIMHVLGFSMAAAWNSALDGELDTLALVRVVIAPIWVLITVWLGSELMHGLLSLLRGARGSRNVTHRAVAYCYATAVLGVVPVVGLRLGLAAALVYQVMALYKAHGGAPSSLWKAILAVVVTWVVLVGLVVLAALGGGALEEE